MSNIEAEIGKLKVQAKEVEYITEKYVRLGFDPFDFLLKDINDRQVRKDIFLLIRTTCLMDWVENALSKNFKYEVPTQDNPFVNPSYWEDLPEFIDTAFLPRFTGDSNELLWLLKIKDRYPLQEKFSRSRFVGATLVHYLCVIATLETLVGKLIAENYGEPNIEDPNYWKVKDWANEQYCLQKSPESILSSVFQDPYIMLDKIIEKFK